MIIPILFFALLIVGIVGIILTKDSWRGDGYVGLTVISTFICIPFVIVMLCASYNNIDFDNEYQIQKEYIESINTNNDLASDERVEIIKNANALNYRILTSRSFGKNIWIGWFFASKPSEYELLDISKISNANQKITINNTNNEQF